MRSTKHLSRSLSLLVANIVILVSLFAPLTLFQRAYAQANIHDSLCAGANLDVTTNCDTGVTDEQAANGINKLITDIINTFSLIVGVVAVIMIIVGGFRYITSGGDSANVSAAKNTILYAIIGLIIVALSQSIVRFILQRVTNV